MTHADVSGALQALTETKQLHDKNSNQVEMVTIKAVSKDGRISSVIGGQVASIAVSKDKKKKKSLCTLCNRFFTQQYLQKHQETMHGQVKKDAIETKRATTNKINQEGDKDSSILNNVSGNTSECCTSSGVVDNLQVGREKYGHGPFEERSDEKLITEHLPSNVSYVKEFDEDMEGTNIIGEKLGTRNARKIHGSKEKRQKSIHSNKQPRKKLKEILKDEGITEEKSFNTSSIMCEVQKSLTIEPAEKEGNANTIVGCEKFIFGNTTDRTPMKMNVEKSYSDFSGDLQREGGESRIAKILGSHIPGNNSGSATVVGGILDNSMSRRSKMLMKNQKEVVDISESFEKEVSRSRGEIIMKKSVTTGERNNRVNADRSELDNACNGTIVKLVFKDSDSVSQRDAVDIIKVSENSSSSKGAFSPSIMGKLKVHGDLHQKGPLYQNNMQHALMTVPKKAETKVYDLNMKIDIKKLDADDKDEPKPLQDTEDAKLFNIQKSSDLIPDIFKTCGQAGEGTDTDDNIDDKEVLKKIVISRSMDSIASTASSPLGSYISGCSGIEPRSPKPVPPVCSVTRIHQNLARHLPQVTELERSTVDKTKAPLVSSPRPFTSPARINFIVEAQGSLIPKGKSRLTFNFAMKPNAPLFKGLLAVEEKLKAVDLEFVCEGNVLTGSELGQEVKGKTVFVRCKDALVS